MTTALAPKLSSPAVVRLNEFECTHTDIQIVDTHAYVVSSPRHVHTVSACLQTILKSVPCSDCQTFQRPLHLRFAFPLPRLHSCLVWDSFLVHRYYPHHLRIHLNQVKWTLRRRNCCWEVKREECRRVKGWPFQLNVEDLLLLSTRRSHQNQSTCAPTR